MNNLINFTTALLLLSSLKLFAQDLPVDSLISKTNSQLAELVTLQKKNNDVHPCLNEYQPIAVAYKDSLLVFDFNPGTESYGLIKKTSQPFPIPNGMEASFPLSVYDNRSTCVITPATLEKSSGFATILHEFIHCCQFNSVETQIKEKIEIYKTAMKENNYSWEITHPFPYNDSVFINYYDSYTLALKSGNLKAARYIREEIKMYLGKDDYEYMLWEEWKEGFARFVENKVRERMGIGLNNYGSKKPYDRIAFYYSGELLIAQLSSTNPKLPEDMLRLYETMKNF